MSNRMKEHEKHERIIRGLLKLPENRRCINCNSLGPQYVCTNFWIFVCTTCSGIHREFTHRVKSVSMAKFTSLEVTSLQGGGNQRAREIYFKEWDLQRQSAPDSSNVDRLRAFIKHVYVDGRYTGDPNFSKPPIGKLGDKEDSYDNRRMEAYEKGSRSPPYEDSYERRYSERSRPVGSSDDKYSRYSYNERRSPGYEQESRQYNDHRRSPAHPEIVNDWRREDRFGNRVSDGDSKYEARSPEMPREPEGCSPPVVRPVREILGDNVLPLRISEPPKANVRKTADGSAQPQRTASSSSLGSTNGTAGEVKLETIKSLIDFDADREPPAAVAVPQTQQAAISQSVAQPASAANGNNWASFDFTPDTKAPQPPSNANSLDSILSQLSVVPSGPDHLLGTPATIIPSTSGSFVAPVGTTMMLPFNPSAPATTQINNLSQLPTGGLARTLPVNGGNSLDKVVEAGQWSSVLQQQPPLFPTSTGISSAQHFTPEFPGSSSNQQTWSSSAVPNVQSLTTSARAPQVASPETTSSGVSQPSSGEVKPSGRGALPEDLFAAVYSPYPSPVAAWQSGPPIGMGFVHYSHVAAPAQTFSQPSKPTNPFDLNEPVQAQPFPTLASLQSALPNMPPPSGLQHTASLGASTQSWMPSPSPYPSTLPLQTPSYASSMPPRMTVAQLVHGSMPPLEGHQVIGSLGRERAAFGAISTDQQVAGRFSAPPTPQPFSSVGGNPFG